MDLSYKELHERFVSNSNGTSLLEAELLLNTPVLLILLSVGLTAWLVTPNTTNRHGVQFFIDFSTHVMWLLFAVTILSEHVTSSFIILLINTSLVLLLWYPLLGKKQNAACSLQSLLNLPLTGRRPFINNFRALCNIGTAISILAVDFTVFPRRFGKAETYGSGLMDAGVGCFIFANALVSPEARGKYQNRRSHFGRFQAVWSSILSSTPLLILGFARVISVKSIDYQEHVSEYGVHWNFFFTLAAVKIMSSLVLCIVDPSFSGLVALLVASGYQYLLSGPYLRRYILYGSDGLGSRNGLLEANREGIFSSLGYLAIYFVGVQCGKFLLRERVRLKDWLHASIYLLFASIFFWILLNYLQTFVDPISRRLANISFVVWMVAHSLLNLHALLLVDIIILLLQETGRLPVIKTKIFMGDFNLLEAVNRNGLFYFLLANILTGLINISMATIEASPLMAVIVLTIYMMLLSTVIAYCHMRNITIKWW